MMKVVVAQNARRYFLFFLTMALVVVFLVTPSAVAAEGKAESEFADVEDLPLQKGLPDPFLMPDGKRVQNQEDWAALLDFADHIFFDKRTNRRFDNLTCPDAELPFDWKAPGVIPAK